jgi:uncharacterized protein with HEPN domain
MTARSFKLFTRDILDSIEKIEEFTEVTIKEAKRVRPGKLIEIYGCFR